MIDRNLHDYLKDQLSQTHDAAEAAGIARILSEYISELPEAQREILVDQCLSRLLSGEPVQYVVGYVWFYHLKIHVNSAVLIPRPETEELVDWLVQDDRKELRSRILNILDVGTGSGCIALAVKRQIPASFVTAIDVSSHALELAMQNAVENNLLVQFRLCDFLNELPEDTYDRIICNPPYITKDELGKLEPHVRRYEPAIALSPESADSLIFYKRLAKAGQTLLKKDGCIYVELNEFNAMEAQALFQKAGFDTEMRKDMQGKWRMMKAFKGKEGKR